MAEIRQLTHEHADAKAALLQFAFQMTLSPEQLEEERKYFRPEWDFGLFDEGGRLLSIVTVFPFETWIGGRKLAMGGVAGVASWPDARRQGGVKRLLQHALADMRRRGQSLSMLAPFSFAFYRKLGYEMTIERKLYTLETKQLPPREATPGTVKIVAKDHALLNAVYESYASQFAGMLMRDAEWWERKVLSKPGIAAAYFDEAGTMQGYVLYEVSDRTFKVYDWAALTEDARKALWSYAANHDSMIKQLTITVPLDDGLPFLLPEPRFKQEVQPYFMSRIVDVEAFIAQYRFAEAERASEVALTIADNHATWNEGSWQLRIEADGAAKLTQAAGSGDGVSAGSDDEGTMGGGETSGELSSNGVSAGSLDANSASASLVCDIRTLTAMLVGNRRPAWLHQVGRLQGPIELALKLERRVPMQRPFLVDFF